MEFIFSVFVFLIADIAIILFDVVENRIGTDSRCVANPIPVLFGNIRRGEEIDKVLCVFLVSALLDCFWPCPAIAPDVSAKSRNRIFSGYRLEFGIIGIVLIVLFIELVGLAPCPGGITGPG